MIFRIQKVLCMGNDAFIRTKKIFLEGDIKTKLNLLIYFISSKIFNKKSCKMVFNNTIKNQDGIFFCGKRYENLWAVIEFYEEKLRPIFKNFKEGVFIDIGSHIGKYTIMVANQVKNRGCVVSIEPEKENFNIINKNLKLNHLRNATLLNIALSSKPGIRRLNISMHGPGSHSFEKIKESKGCRPVKTDTLDNIVKSMNLMSVDLIKIDVEGHELDVLKGAKRTAKLFKPKIIVEIGNIKKQRKCEKMIKTFGYEIAQKT